LRLLQGAQEDLYEAVRKMPLHPEAKNRLTVVTKTLAVAAIGREGTDSGLVSSKIAVTGEAADAEGTTAVTSSNADLESLYRLQIRELAQETDAADDEADRLRIQLRRAEKRSAHTTKQVEKMRLELRELRTFVAAQEERHTKEMNALAAANERLLIRFRQARCAFERRRWGAADASREQSRLVIEEEPVSLWEMSGFDGSSDSDLDMEGYDGVPDRRNAGYDGVDEQIPAEHNSGSSSGRLGKGPSGGGQPSRRGIQSASERLAAVSTEQRLLQQQQQQQPTRPAAELTNLPECLDHPIRSWSIAAPTAGPSRAIGTAHQASRRRRAVDVDANSGRSSDSSLASDG
jgi:hypothetical protein